MAASGDHTPRLVDACPRPTTSGVCEATLIHVDVVRAPVFVAVAAGRTPRLVDARPRRTTYWVC